MSIFWRPRGCVAWYDFAELRGNTVYDLSGYDNHGTIYGPAWKRGRLIGCLDFDGKDDYVVVPKSDSLVNVEDWSMEVLFSIKGDTGYTENIISHYGTGLVAHRGIRFVNGKIGYFVRDDAEYEAVRYPVSAIYDKYYLAVLLKRGTMVEFWVDGDLIDSVDGFTSFTTDLDLVIGSLAYLPPREVLYGTCALARIYNRALIKRETKAHHHYLQKTIHLINPLVL